MSDGAGNRQRAGVASLAVADLAARLDMAADDIEVLEVREVTWRDGSLGCPKPEMSYRQMLVNGSLIRLSAGGQVYQYHSGRNRAPFLCENPAEPLSNGDRGFDPSI